ncbi:LapA family protein [Bartonella sp. F02]|uniref:LapA family protein n=1 Tax=Bartonella sp. F02 TaxID=2967262 RepID=UPI0022A957F9|nr:LapA family protein [Bartonella sp. F02]MCZ2327941.1 LapA family protein [Bartonella sp. F02]
MKTKQIFLIIILVPLTILLIAFIVANRQMVTLVLNPFQNNSESLSFRAPLFVWLFTFFSLGVLFSSIINWFTQHHYRKALKESKNEIEKLKMSTNVYIDE